MRDYDRNREQNHTCHVLQQSLTVVGQQSFLWLTVLATVPFQVTIQSESLDFPLDVNLRALTWACSLFCSCAESRKTFADAEKAIRERAEFMHFGTVVQMSPEESTNTLKNFYKYELTAEKLNLKSFNYLDCSLAIPCCCNFRISLAVLEWVELHRRLHALIKTFAD